MLLLNSYSQTIALLYADRYLLELMFPNDEFAEFIRSGLDQGPMSTEDLCALIQVGCAQ